MFCRPPLRNQFDWGMFSKSTVAARSEVGPTDKAIIVEKIVRAARKLTRLAQILIKSTPGVKGKPCSPENRSECNPPRDYGQGFFRRIRQILTVAVANSEFAARRT